MANWTLFWDMHSGGGCKEEPFEHIYIEAPEEEAAAVFFSRFGHSPYRVTCTCCGKDYSIREGESLEDVSAFQRRDNLPPGFPHMGETLSMSDYESRPDVLVIRASEIKYEDRRVEVPEQGYVWKD